MSSTRDQIIETTSRLIEMHGYHATGINEIIRESGAPKGSLYYYFPDGKEELAAEAVGHAANQIVARIESSLEAHDAPGDAVRHFIEQLAHYVEAGGYDCGGPLTTITLETATTSERLNEACRESYTRIQSAFETKLLESGYEKERAARLATLINAAIEGAITLSRTHHSPTPLYQTAEELAALLQRG
ncbi:MAG: TetR/AcrR family transcriptional regulator [Chloroflexi bacterium]|nr:TetR/AcrR family transcriptional regulator [Chloroflexota bacterium]